MDNAIEFRGAINNEPIPLELHPRKIHSYAIFQLDREQVASWLAGVALGVRCSVRCSCVAMAINYLLPFSNAERERETERDRSKRF